MYVCPAKLTVQFFSQDYLGMLVLEFPVDKENIALHQSRRETFDYILILHWPTRKGFTGVL